jgi:hypothetical protein
LTCTWLDLGPSKGRGFLNYSDAPIPGGRNILYISCGTFKTPPLDYWYLIGVNLVKFSLLIGQCSRHLIPIGWPNVQFSSAPAYLTIGQSHAAGDQ